MLQQTILLCLLLLTMCHVCLFEQCYTSPKWHMKSKVDRPFVVKGHQKNSHRGVFTMKRGTQTLQHSPVVPHMLATTQGVHHINSFISCTSCGSRSHQVTECPLLRCCHCSKFGHVSASCKKTLPDK
jgi:hypothetical protein